MTDEVNDTGLPVGVDTSATPTEQVEQQDEQVVNEESTTSETEDSAAPPKRKGVGKRIDELVRQREEARREIEYWRSKAVQAQPEPAKAQPSKPDPQKFNSYEDYLDALADWKVEQRLEERLTKERESREKAEQEAIHRQRITQAQQTFDSKAEKAREKYEDFDDVVFDKDLAVTEVMGQTILESDNGAEVLYYLGNNPREALRISRLSPVAQVREIGKLEDKLSQSPPAARASSAPAPIKPVGTKAAAEKAPHEMTEKEFAAWRKKVIAQRR